ncbi:hypothetical protein FRC05_010314 [Tulasnella sp. 425]|nr:hypothetical protein FRC05_010314 [Tulasnella sp. 425]
MGTISNELSPNEEQKLSMILSDIRKHIPNRPIRESIQLLETMAIQRFQLAAQTVLKECLEIILDSAMLPEVAKISHLSRAYRASVLDYLRRRVDGLLRTWFTDPACFRDILRTTGSMVSGSTALAFALGVDWGLQDLDIYVGSDTSGVGNPAGRRAQMLRHLVEVEGYRPQAAFGDASDPTFSKISSIPFRGASNPYDVDIDIINTVYKLTKTTTTTTEEGRITTVTHTTTDIDVIECVHTNPIEIVSDFHSTPVMNWISADNITITYPVLTFAMRGIVNRNRLTFNGKKEKLWKEKYAAPATTLAACGCHTAKGASWTSSRQ